MTRTIHLVSESVSRPTISADTSIDQASPPASTDRPNAIVISGVFDVAVTELPPGFTYIDEVVRELEERPGGIERMERARRRLAQRLSQAGLQRSLSFLRISNGWSQTTLGKMVGATQAQIARYESGRTTPNAEHLARLAHALGISADELLVSLGIDNSLLDPHG